MTATQLQAMQEGRKAADERRQAAHRANREVFVGWVRDEAMAYKRLILAREFGGGESVAAADAQAAYDAVLRAAPSQLPPDSAWAA
jgi:predicted deacylase